jgi:hypothetical protein
MPRVEGKDVDPNTALKDLLVAAAPEQKLHLEGILRQYDLEVLVEPNSSDANLAATPGRIKFDNKTMQVYWLLGFAGWRVIECYTPAIIASLCGLGSLHDCLHSDTGLSELEGRYRERVHLARALLRATNTDRFEWPAEVPAVGTERNELAPQDQATHDLTLISTAFAFLHELRHVIFFRDGAPPARAEEELSCDVWARDFLTARVGEYARTNGTSYERVLRKRSIASALGLLTLYETSDRWGDAGTEHYPPIADRMNAAMRGTPLQPNDPFWVYYAAVLVAILRHRNRAFDAAGASAMDYCEALVEEIRQSS